MAAITRLQQMQLLHSPLTLKPSVLSPNPNQLRRSRPRTFSTDPPTPLLSLSLVSAAGANTSIVGDLLDYLNESWTHFHATAEAKRQLIAAGFHLLSGND